MTEVSYPRSTYNIPYLYTVSAGRKVIIKLDTSADRIGYMVFITFPSTQANYSLGNASVISQRSNLVRHMFLSRRINVLYTVS